MYFPYMPISFNAERLTNFVFREQTARMLARGALLFGLFIAVRESLPLDPPSVKENAQALKCAKHLHAVETVFTPDTVPAACDTYDNDFAEVSKNALGKTGLKNTVYRMPPADEFVSIYTLDTAYDREVHDQRMFTAEMLLGGWVLTGGALWMRRRLREVDDQDSIDRQVVEFRRQIDQYAPEQ